MTDDRKKMIDALRHAANALEREEGYRFEVESIPAPEVLTRESLRAYQRALQHAVMIPWQSLYDLVTRMDLPGHHAIFMQHPIKTPSLEVYDNIGSLVSELIEVVATREAEKNKGAAGLGPSSTQGPTA